MYLVFDIGGTNMRLGFSKTGKKLEGFEAFPTPEKFSDGVRFFVDRGRKLLGKTRVKLVAGCSVGPFNRDKTEIFNAPNLPQWNGKPLKKEIARAFKAPVFLENDAALAGLGEAVFGAGRGSRIVAYFTISTGVGGARIVGGRIDDSSQGFEPGQQVLSSEAGTNQNLGMLVSGRGLEVRYGKKAAEIAEPAIWDQAARHLAIGLFNSCLHWSPDAVVLGGSVAKSLDLDKVRQYFAEVSTVFPKVVPIKKAALGGRGGLFGALALIKHHGKNL